MDGMKFLLVEVIEQDIAEPKFFPTQNAAEAEMRERIKSCMGYTDEDFAQAEECGYAQAEEEDDIPNLWCIDDNLYFSHTAARGEYMGQNHDWKIFEV